MPGTQEPGKAEGGSGGRTLLRAANPRIKSKAIPALPRWEAMGGKRLNDTGTRLRDTCYDKGKLFPQKNKKGMLQLKTQPHQPCPLGQPQHSCPTHSYLQLLPSPVRQLHPWVTFRNLLPISDLAIRSYSCHLAAVKRRLVGL